MKLISIATEDLKNFTIKGLDDDLVWTTTISSLYGIINLLDCYSLTRTIILKLIDLKNDIPNFRFVVKEHAEVFNLSSVGLIDEDNICYILNGDTLDFADSSDFKVCNVFQINIV